MTSFETLTTYLSIERSVFHPATTFFFTRNDILSPCPHRLLVCRWRRSGTHRGVMRTRIAFPPDSFLYSDTDINELEAISSHASSLLSRMNAVSIPITESSSTTTHAFTGFTFFADDLRLFCIESEEESFSTSGEVGFHKLLSPLFLLIPKELYVLVK